MKVAHADKIEKMEKKEEKQTLEETGFSFIINLV